MRGEAEGHFVESQMYRQQASQTASSSAITFEGQSQDEDKKEKYRNRNTRPLLINSLESFLLNGKHERKLL